MIRNLSDEFLVSKMVISHVIKNVDGNHTITHTKQEAFNCEYCRRLKGFGPLEEKAPKLKSEVPT